MNAMLRDQDQPIWDAALPWLDVRCNDEHTLIAYSIAKALIHLRPEAQADIILPAILLHDVGWKTVPEDKLAGCVGPKPIYPDLVVQHEKEGARIARDILSRRTDIDVETVAAIIDGHDTRKHALSLDDAVVKDSDKLWRFTDHGVRTIASWLNQTIPETTAMVAEFVPRTLLTDEGRVMAAAFVAEQEGMLSLVGVRGRKG